MTNVLLDMAMSLDGDISGPNGEDHGLHDYVFSPAGPTVEVIGCGPDVGGPEGGYEATVTRVM